MNGGTPPRRPRQVTPLTVLLIVLLALGIFRLGGNLVSKSRPPAACQDLGGNWTWWDGWSCG